MEGAPEPGLPPGWRRTVTAGELMWAKGDGTTAISDYTQVGGNERRHVVIVQGPNGNRPPYDEVAEIAQILSHGAPLAIVPASFANQALDAVVLVETSDPMMSDIWRAVARTGPGEEERHGD